MRNERDFYPTPHSILKALFKECYVYGEVWEPCAGDGRVVEYLKREGCFVHSGDIETGQDFFEYKKALAPSLVTNPPFKDIRRFIDHAFAIGVERMILVCPERIWASGIGRRQFERHRPSRFLNLDWREDYLGKGGSPDRALAIAVWNSPCSTHCEYKVLEKLQ